MNLTCLFTGHMEECGLLDKDGNWYKARVFDIPLNGTLRVYWKCTRCGRIREKTWGLVNE